MHLPWQLVERLVATLLVGPAAAYAQDVSDARARWIGRGVGAALMQAALREADARGCDAIWLDVWENNNRAIDFYRRWGFVEIGTQPFRLGNDTQRDLLMVRHVLL
jgi:ribosomal protein S18 acetylase RimI-like enzyme